MSTGICQFGVCIPDEELFSETAVGCTASYFVKIIWCSCWFRNPHPLFWGWILHISRSPKGGCCSISDDLSFSSINKGLISHTLVPLAQPLLTDRLENADLGEDVEYLFFKQDLSNIPFIDRWVEVDKYRKSEATAVIFINGSCRKNRNLVEDVEYLLPVKFRQNPFSGCTGEAKMCQQIRGHCGHICWRIGPKTQTW